MVAFFKFKTSFALTVNYLSMISNMNDFIVFKESYMELFCLQVIFWWPISSQFEFSFKLFCLLFNGQIFVLKV